MQKKNVLTIFLLILLCLCPQQLIASYEMNNFYKKCIHMNSEAAVKNCEQYVNEGGEQYYAYLKLAKIYQKQGKYHKAATTFEKALEINDSQRSRNRAALAKSNAQEHAWLKENSTKTSENSVRRKKCIKFEKLIPNQALQACSEYLDTYPNDQEILTVKSRIISSMQTKKNNVALDNNIKQSDVTDVKNTSQQIIKNKNIKPKTESVQVQRLSEQDSKALEDIRAELNKLYKIIDQQNRNSEKSKSKNIQYFEQGKRYAIVIGNSRYIKKIGSLKNPENDAKDIASVLRNSEFEVTTLINASLDEMEKTVTKVVSRIKRNDTLLFYYAGHGIALSGENYLLPSNANIRDAVDIKYKSMNMSYVIEKIERGAMGTTIVILDACRNNPFAEDRGLSRGGLASIKGPTGTLIAYATAPGDIAQDGKGRNGVYTKHLLRQIQKPNLKIEDMFKRVRVAVEMETGGTQIPWENSSLKGDFYFNIN